MTFTWTQKLFDADGLFEAVDDGFQENVVETKRRGRTISSFAIRR